jgi:hypothetical protein
MKGGKDNFSLIVERSAEIQMLSMPVFFEII